MNNYLNGFEKTALNALKKRQLAKQFGLIPDGDWKWGLRQMRKGKTKEQLGHAPEKLTNRVRGQGKEIEVGAMYNKGDNPKKVRVIKGGEVSVDLTNIQKRLAKDPKALDAATKAMTEGGYKNLGRTAAHTLRLDKPYSGMSSIHSHPPKAMGPALEQEKIMSEAFKDTDAAKEFLRHLPARTSIRMKRIIDKNNPRVGEEIIKRHQLKYPELGPSGATPGGPGAMTSSDKGFFKKRDLGTHNTIVSGERSSVHTNRPDKINNQPKHKGKGSIPGEAQYPFAKRRLRSLYFEAADKKTKK